MAECTPCRVILVKEPFFMGILRRHPGRFHMALRTIPAELLMICVAGKVAFVADIALNSIRRLRMACFFDYPGGIFAARSRNHSGGRTPG